MPSRLPAGVPAELLGHQERLPARLSSQLRTLRGCGWTLRRRVRQIMFYPGSVQPPVSTGSSPVDLLGTMILTLPFILATLPGEKLHVSS